MLQPMNCRLVRKDPLMLKDPLMFQFEGHHGMAHADKPLAVVYCSFQLLSEFTELKHIFSVQAWPLAGVNTAVPAAFLLKWKYPSSRSCSF